jgi:hypothetical protein
MIKFYTNKQLSQATKINLAKWKRWSREFLPPDPLGGLQSGYARQYNLNEAFTIFLGGHLVGDMKYTIPESRQILNDLHQWLIDHDFYFDFSGDANAMKTSDHRVQNYQIAIINRKIAGGRISGFFYWVKAVLSVESVEFDDDQVSQERFQDSFIGLPADMSPLPSAESYSILNINTLRRNFLTCLQEIT